jgi:hypothetical protein
MSPRVRPARDHLAPEVKVANEITWSHGHYSAFVVQSAESLLACLINFFPKSFSALSVFQSHPTTFLEDFLGFRVRCFHLVTGLVSPAYWEGCPCQEPRELVDRRGGSLSPGKLRSQVLFAQRNL